MYKSYISFRLANIPSKRDYSPKRNLFRMQKAQYFTTNYSWQHVWLMPWTEGLASYGWVMAMGFLVAAACGVLGVFLMLRRMALVGDAMSHSVLPGIVGAFLISGSRSSWVMGTGAAVAGVLTTFFIEIVYKYSRLKADAALAVVFSTAFAVGVLLLSLFASHIDLDLDCVLFGEIAFVPLSPGFQMGEITIPEPVVRMGGIFLLLLILLIIFFKELVLSTFDPALARAQGLPVMIIHYSLMTLLALAVVAAFEAVGAILVIAMLIFPMATVRFWVDRLPGLLMGAIFLAAVYAILGLHLALLFDCSIAAAMGTTAFLIFLLNWGAKAAYEICRKLLSAQSVDYRT